MVRPEIERELKAHTIPDWLGKALNEEGSQKIEAAVRAAEEKTAGEIVPVIVQSSTVNASAPILAVLAAGFVVLALKHGLWLHDPWDFAHAWPWYGLFLLAGIFGVLFGRSRTGQIWLTPRWEKRRQVYQRAVLAFYQAGLNQTTGRTGILLFISWREHQAIVLADEGIAKHCDAKTFEDVVQELVRGARDHELAQGFAKAVAMSGDILAKTIPILPGDRNELRDTLRILD